MRYLFFISVLFLSCNTAKTYQLNGHKSISCNGALKFKWSVLSGDANILSPDSIETKVVVKKTTMIKLTGIDEAGMIGSDTTILKTKYEK